MEEQTKNFFIKYDVSPMVPHATYDESFSGGDSSSELEYDNFNQEDQHVEIHNGDSSASCPEMDDKWSETETSTVNPAKKVDVKPDISDGIKFPLLSSTSHSFSQSQIMDQSLCYSKNKSPNKTIPMSNNSQMDVDPATEDKKTQSDSLKNVVSRPQIHACKAFEQEPITACPLFGVTGTLSMTGNESSTSPHSLTGLSNVCTRGLDANRNPTAGNNIISIPSTSTRKSGFESERVSQSKPNLTESYNKTDSPQQRQEQSKLEKMKMRRERKQQNKCRNVTIIEKTSANSEQLDIDTVVQHILNGSSDATKRKKSQNKQKQKLKNVKTNQPPDKEKKSTSDSSPLPPSPVEMTKKSKSADTSLTSGDSKSSQETSKESVMKNKKPNLVQENKDVKQSSEESHILKKSNDISITSQVITNVTTPVSSSPIHFNEPSIVSSSSCSSTTISKAVVEGLVAFTDFESLNSSPEDTFQLVTSRKEKVKKMAARGNGQHSITQSSNQLATKTNPLISTSKRPPPVPSVVAATDKVIPFGGKSEPSRRFPAPHNVSGLPQTPRLPNNESNHPSSVTRPVMPGNQWPSVSSCCNNSAINNNVRGNIRHSTTATSMSSKSHSTATPSVRPSSTTTTPVCNGDNVSTSLMRRGSAASKNDDVFYESSNIPSSNPPSHLADTCKPLHSSKLSSFPPLSNGTSKISTNIKTPLPSESSFEQTVQSSRVSSQSNSEKSFIQSVPSSGTLKSCRIEEKKPLSRISQPKPQQQLEYLEEKWQLFLQEFNEMRNRQPELVGTF